ncbi:unnamed protein product [Adineta steineri]|uniref:Uncharacterized protein n=1 Tax=Adineta steineri TaxID=433720 RepID=A0A819C7G5_9BILA|nr:unnamed protein product [Adineta steineri]CAF1233874.1 unnamed protein product [Adineta steineri]CAF3807070.1 unnamed protein product [Adineta steineri]CAF4148962.1 unnamed protein product [Adineta steineri]
MDTCQFTYIRRLDDTKRTAVGVEQAWEVLCAKLHRDGPGLRNGTHYFTISVDGPQLFAVDANGTDIYYHDCGQWCRYITASDIIFSTIPDTGSGCPPRATDDSHK